MNGRTEMPPIPSCCASTYGTSVLSATLLAVVITIRTERRKRPDCTSRARCRGLARPLRRSAALRGP